MIQISLWRKKILLLLKGCERQVYTFSNHINGEFDYNPLRYVFSYISRINYEKVIALRLESIAYNEIAIWKLLYRRVADSDIPWCKCKQGNMTVAPAVIVNPILENNGSAFYSVPFIHIQKDSQALNLLKEKIGKCCLLV